MSLQFTAHPIGFDARASASRLEQPNEGAAVVLDDDAQQGPLRATHRGGEGAKRAWGAVVRIGPRGTGTRKKSGSKAARQAHPILSDLKTDEHTAKERSMPVGRASSKWKAERANLLRSQSFCSTRRPTTHASAGLPIRQAHDVGQHAISRRVRQTVDPQSAAIVEGESRCVRFLFTSRAPRCAPRGPSSNRQLARFRKAPGPNLDGDAPARRPLASHTPWHRRPSKQREAWASPSCSPTKACGRTLCGESALGVGSAPGSRSSTTRRRKRHHSRPA